MASESVGRCAHVSARGVRCKSEPCPSAAWHRADDTEWNQCSADCRACALERGEAIATPPAAGPAPTLRDQFAMAGAAVCLCAYTSPSPDAFDGIYHWRWDCLYLNERERATCHDLYAPEVERLCAAAGAFLRWGAEVAGG